MLNLSRKTDYALVALAHLATLRPADAEQAQSARTIAETYELPKAMLMNLLKQLHRRGLLESTRGAAGGYSLKRTPGSITVGQVVDAVEGPMQMAPCCTGDEDQPCTDCQVFERCPIRGSINRLNACFDAMLHGVTLEDLIQGRVVDAIKQAMVNCPTDSSQTAFYAIGAQLNAREVAR